VEVVPVPAQAAPAAGAMAQRQSEQGMVNPTLAVAGAVWVAKALPPKAEQVAQVLLLSVLLLLILVRVLWLLLVELKQRSLVMVLMVIWVKTTRFILSLLMAHFRFL